MLGEGKGCFMRWRLKSHAYFWPLSYPLPLKMANLLEVSLEERKQTHCVSSNVGPHPILDSRALDRIS